MALEQAILKNGHLGRHFEQTALPEPARKTLERSMSKSTLSAAARAETAVAPPRSGMFGRFFAALREARQLQADSEVEIYLVRQPDRMLQDIGMADADIQLLRERHGR